MSLLEYIRTEAAPRPGKATAEDLILAGQKIPDLNTERVPANLFRDDGKLSPENFLILLWIQARHEDKAITPEQIASMLDITSKEKYHRLIAKVIAFWSDDDEDTVYNLITVTVDTEGITADGVEAIPVEDAGSEEPNPTPLETNSTTTPE